MSEPKWTHNIDPEVGEFYDAPIKVNGKEILALIVAKTPEGWEGCIESHGEELQILKLGPCPPDVAAFRLAFECSNMLCNMLSCCNEIIAQTSTLPQTDQRPAR